MLFLLSITLVTGSDSIGVIVSTLLVLLCVTVVVIAFGYTEFGSTVDYFFTTDCYLMTVVLLG
jgi:hypothetical protein